MPKQIKKHGKKALIFGLMILVAVMYVSIAPTQAGNLSSRSDTLSDSRPSETAQHTLKFTTATELTIDAGTDGDFSFKFLFPTTGDPDPFTIPDFSGTDVTASCTSCGGKTLTMVDVIESDEDSDLDYDAVLVVIDAGTSGSLIAGSVVTVNLGVSTTKVTNPSSTESYKIDIRTTESLDNPITTVDGPNQVMVYIIAGVTVEATVAESLTFARAGMDDELCLGDTGTIDTTINTSGDADLIPFGTLGNNFTVACQELTVSTNAAKGYVVTEQEDDQLRFDSTTFPDCTCDSSGCLNANSSAAAWLTDPGFGHGCEMSDGDGAVCAAEYDVWDDNQYYRQFASIADGDTAQTLMTYTVGAPTEDHVAIVHYKIKRPGTQAAGTYQNTVVYIATPTY